MEIIFDSKLASNFQIVPLSPAEMFNRRIFSKMKEWPKVFDCSFGSGFKQKVFSFTAGFLVHAFKLNYNINRYQSKFFLNAFNFCYREVL